MRSVSVDFLTRKLPKYETGCDASLQKRGLLNSKQSIQCAPLWPHSFTRRCLLSDQSFEDVCSELLHFIYRLNAASDEISHWYQTLAKKLHVKCLAVCHSTHNFTFICGDAASKISSQSSTQDINRNGNKRIKCFNKILQINNKFGLSNANLKQPNIH